MIYLIFFVIGFLVGNGAARITWWRDLREEPEDDEGPVSFVDPVTFKEKYKHAKSVDDLLEK